MKTEYQKYLEKEIEIFLRKKAIEEIEAEDPNQTEGRDV